MKDRLEAIITAMIIAALSFGLPGRGLSIDNVVNQDKNKPKVEEAQQDSTKTQPKRWYQFAYNAGSGFMLNNVSWNYTGNYDMTNSIFKGQFSDDFTISYDYVGKRGEAGETLKND